MTTRWMLVMLAVGALLGSPGAAVGAEPTVDDGKIAFVRDARGKPGCAIVVMKVDGSGQRRLTGWNASCSSPAVWSPDGTRLTYYARDALWMMNGDGTRRGRLAPATYTDVDEFPGPSFSPDGRSIVFAGNPSSTVNASAIYVVHGRGRPKRLTKERFAYDPLWSPRGDLIAFRSDRDDDEGDIYLMRPDGGGQRRLTHNEDDAESYVWSHDGRFLAYGFYAGAVFRVPASGGPRRLLTWFSAAEPGLAWSPDGRYIAYVDESRGDDISVMTARGFHERRLTKRFYNFAPGWSPDSRRIAFGFFTRLKAPSRYGIAVIDADGRNRHELTHAADTYPAWQPMP